MPLNDRDCAYRYSLARDDEKSVRILAREGGPSDIAAFHFHQAVEKTLKGAIAEKGGDIPRIHDLERLFKTVERSGFEFKPGDFDSVAPIQSYYSDLRYPRGERLGQQDLERIIIAYETLGFLRESGELSG